MGPSGSELAGGHAQIVLWGSLAAVATCLLVAFLIFLCSGCDREKKPRQHSGDHENLMNVPSDKEVFSRSVTSLATDAPASSEQNGLLTNGDILSEDSATTCAQHYEEVQTSAADLLDAQEGAGRPRCPQSRELPRIPADSGPGAAAERGTAGLEGPYEVLKDSASQETVVDDCLYETVKEVKEVKEAPTPLGGGPTGRPKPAPAGRAPPAPRAPDAADVAEYASVDRNKKCRQSADVESVPRNPGDPEEEAPPPIPVKLLDENENLQDEEERKAGEGRAPGGPAPDASKRLSSLSYKSRHEDPTLTEEEISAMYSSVNKPGQSGNKSGQSLKAPESSHTCGPGAAQRSPSSCSDLYATVKDFEKTAHCASLLPAAGRPREDSEPDYEAIQAVDREEEKAALEASGHHGPCPRENDYKSIGDLQQGRDITRL